jgi:hypothetical protein
MRELQSDTFAEEARMDRGTLEHVFQRIQWSFSPGPPMSKWFWAVSMVLSRQYVTGNGDHAWQRALVPFADLLNHRPLGGHLDIVQGGREKAADRHTRAGEEVTVAYDSSLPNLSLLRVYGFVSENPVHDYYEMGNNMEYDSPAAKKVALQLFKDIDEEWSARAAVIDVDATTLQVVLRFSKSGVLPATLAYCRVMSLPDAAAARVLKEETDTSKLLSLENEMAALGTVRQAAELLQTEFTSTVEHDMAVLREGSVSPRLMHLVLFRLYRKRAVEATLRDVHRLLESPEDMA